MRVEKDNELALIARELTLLQSNMLKDQKRLEGVIADKQAALDSQSAEADRLRKQNKKLQLQLHSLQSKSKQQLAAMQVSKDSNNIFRIQTSNVVPLWDINFSRRVGSAFFWFSI